MKVRIINAGGYQGRVDGRLHKQWSVVDFPDELAVKLIRYRIAEPVREKEPERAVKVPREKTSKGVLTTKAFSPDKDDKE